MQSRALLRAELALLLVCLIWGFNFVVMKLALRELDPFAFNGLRILTSTLFLGLLHWREAQRPNLNRSQWLQILGLSVLGYFAYQVLFLTGLARTTAANSSLLIASSPVFTGIIGWFLGERLAGRGWLGLGLAFMGTVVIAAQKGDVDTSADTLVGNGLILGAAIAWGSYTGFSRNITKLVPPSSLAFYTTAVSLPLHLILAVPHMEPVWAGDLSPGTYGAILYSGILSTGLAYALWNAGVRQVGAAPTAVFINLVPLFALAAAWLWLDEEIVSMQILGGVGVLAGVWLLRTARK